MKRIKQALISIMLFASCVGYAFAGQDTLLALSARTATTTSSDVVKSTEKGIHVVVRVTVVPGTDTITPKIQAKDFLGNYYDLLVGTAISTTGTTVLKLGPGIAPVANASAADVLPDMYRVVVTHSAGSSFTYSVTLQKAN